MKARLYEKYVKEVAPALKEKRKYTNVHEVPRMEKIVVNMGVSASLEKSAVDDAAMSFFEKAIASPSGREPGDFVTLARYREWTGRADDGIAVLREGRLIEMGTLAEMRHLSAVTVEVTFEGDAPDLSTVDGVVSATSAGRHADLQVRGHRIVPTASIGIAVSGATSTRYPARSWLGDSKLRS